MASSLYSNAQHVDFESVLGMDDPGMVSMFEALMASGLRGFLGCPAIVYEDALIDFFENASVRKGVIISTMGGQLVEISEALFAESFELPIVYEDALIDFFENASVRSGVVISTVGGQLVEISEKLFAETFELPVDGNLIFDARSIVSFSGEPISLSGRKNQNALSYRLLCDIVAKAISVKAGSFNAITVEKFSLLTAVVCGVKMNWAKFLFGVLKKMLVEISEKLFAETFELPIDGLVDLSEMPKDAVFDARSIVSLSGEPISLSGRKNQMKMPFRLLCDIVAKAISVKAGSFNAITVEKFSLLTAVVFGGKMNWAKFLFGVLKKMVTAGSKQAKGFAIQISVLLATFPSVELGESSEFPSSKVLTKKTVLRFVSINDRDGAEEVTGAAKKKAVSKKRPAADVEAAVPKKKRTSKKKSISSISSLELVEVAEEAVPIQQVAEPLDIEEPRCSSADAVDLIIQQEYIYLQWLFSSWSFREISADGMRSAVGQIE
ncbi:dystroglycan-like [Dorcoceras hygrometricum]|uniref:Dystroglycan-like n=1 Tax=Dorcoceras hygrometricum TaxID=472368 RepID=A0A2Z7BG34_9LAMI|nr:dystroglycan-like [Dorcoceras hygrometricum]